MFFFCFLFFGFLFLFFFFGSDGAALYGATGRVPYFLFRSSEAKVSADDDLSNFLGVK
jgi:hypothetical protein